MRWIELTVSLVWGLFLALLLVGAAQDGSIGLIVYTGCALAVWLSGFVIALRRGRSSRLALTVIPLSLLGPLAVIPVAILRRRKSRPPTPLKPSEPPPKEPPPPTPVVLAPKPPQPAVARQPATRPHRSTHPNQVLAAMLVGSALAFPVVGLAGLLLLVLGGATLLTPQDIRNVAFASGALAGIALVSTGVVWQERSSESSTRARRVGWSLIAAVGAMIAAATVVFTQGTSPKNLGRPSVSGSARVGLRLTGHVGRWTAPGGPLSFDYQWQRCAHVCVDINEATHKTYLPAARDVHKRLRLSVAASPRDGVLDFSSRWAHSRETSPVVP